MSNSCDEREPRKVPFSEIAKGLNQGLESADPLRLAALERLARARAVKETELKREQERLTAKLGAGHARVAALKAKLEVNRELARDIDIGVLRGRTPIVHGDKESWTLHGHVRRKKDRSAVPNLTVALYDAQGHWQQEFGYACTDQDGYFKLCHRPTPTTEVDAALERAAARPEGGRELCIRLMDEQGKDLYIGRHPLVLRLGRVDYREILLDDGGAVCRPPDEQPKPAEEKPTRYLGNANKREVHDFTKSTPRCQIDAIRPRHRLYFKTQREAIAAGYNLCAYCFGKEKSER